MLLSHVKLFLRLLTLEKLYDITYHVYKYIHTQDIKQRFSGIYDV